MLLGTIYFTVFMILFTAMVSDFDTQHMKERQNGRSDKDKELDEVLQQK